MMKGRLFLIALVCSIADARRSLAKSALTVTSAASTRPNLNLEVNVSQYEGEKLLGDKSDEAKNDTQLKAQSLVEQSGAQSQSNAPERTGKRDHDTFEKADGGGIDRPMKRPRVEGIGSTNRYDTSGLRPCELGDWNRATQPNGDKVAAPFMVLINPTAGDKAGGDILSVMQRDTANELRYLSLIDVQKFKLAFTVRQNLEFMRSESILRDNLRPRLVCGGGDGTPSWCLNVLLKALQKKVSEGEWPFHWSEEDMEKYMPAFAHLPLGTGNDLGRILNVGKSYPGSGTVFKCTALNDWLQQATSVDAPVASLDVWGVKWSDSVAIAELEGYRDRSIGCDHKSRQCQFTQMRFKASMVPPALFMLYASAGFDAELVARFQTRRWQFRTGNLFEYVRQFVSMMTPSQLPSHATSSIDEHGELQQSRADKGNLRYTLDAGEASDFTSTLGTAGAMNVNSYVGGMLGADPPADISDGFLNFFQRGEVTASTTLNTKPTKVLKFKSKVPEPTNHGVFFQWDGEARLMFNRREKPEGIQFSFSQLMTMPFVMPGATTLGSAVFSFGVDSQPDASAKNVEQVMRWLNDQLGEKPTEQELDSLNRFAWDDIFTVPDVFYNTSAPDPLHFFNASEPKAKNDRA